LSVNDVYVKDNKRQSDGFTYKLQRFDFGIMHTIKGTVSDTVPQFKPPILS